MKMFFKVCILITEKNPGLYLYHQPGNEGGVGKRKMKVTFF